MLTFEVESIKKKATIKKKCTAASCHPFLIIIPLIYYPVFNKLNNLMKCD